MINHFVQYKLKLTSYRIHVLSLTLTYTERSGLSFKKFVLFTGYEVDANEQELIVNNLNIFLEYVDLRYVISFNSNLVKSAVISFKT
jgi:hypothetical protein